MLSNVGNPVAVTHRAAHKIIEECLSLFVIRCEKHTANGEQRITNNEQ
jgi:hypothetical protein